MRIINNVFIIANNINNHVVRNNKNRNIVRINSIVLNVKINFKISQYFVIYKKVCNKKIYEMI